MLRVVVDRDGQAERAPRRCRAPARPGAAGWRRARRARALDRSCRGCRGRSPRRPARSSIASRSSQLELDEQLLCGEAGRADDPPVDRLARGVDDADQHLGSAQVDADRFDRRGQRGRGRSRGIRGGMRQYYPRDEHGRPRPPGASRVQRLPRGIGRAKPGPKGRAAAAERRSLRRAGDGTRGGQGLHGLQSPPRLQAPLGRPELRCATASAAGTATPRPPGEKPLWRRVLKWAALALGAWLLLSLVLFVVSAQIQKGKLDDSAGDVTRRLPAARRLRRRRSS